MVVHSKAEIEAPHYGRAGVSEHTEVPIDDPDSQIHVFSRWAAEHVRSALELLGVGRL